ncbi:MAG: hypothetical protein CMI36_14895 [Owenweeksia sp.]|nr:hypothetical protein [Owenweeksia sp.]MBG00279.1 hypothetical protein [Owenweeksia sp.]HBF21695.1 hypothetical protein [Cryomorphaceae bacterium]HCQ16473.1 hypothetical protein [Cryomorphaceae bacterium]|tara:strand:+ start:717 stop:1703 length:987 start_codon:yes stop_codon:yes gene_type:complete
MNIITKILPTSPRKRKWASIILTILLAAPLTLWGIYKIGEYGIALFILTPLFIGLASTVLYGYEREITLQQATRIGFETLGIFTLGLIAFAVEGLICIAMAAPIGVLFTWMGALLGFSIIKKRPDRSLTSLVVLLIFIPVTAFVESKSEPNVKPVTTKVIINASVETVWKNVIEFPPLDAPTEFIFNAGIAYPVKATIEGEGVGAIRHCNFNTGSFVEPITTWDKPNLLQFDVLQQPQPLKELSFWTIDAPHLHDYFVSEKGQFKLTELPNGQTELEGTTWYHHNIKPDLYWRIWSDWIIHSIHKRVLNHIKTQAEQEKASVKILNFN